MKRKRTLVWLLAVMLVLLLSAPGLSATASELRNEVLETEVLETIDAISSELIAMNDWMYHNPEAGYEEYEAVKLLTSYLQKQGFTVEIGSGGLDTAFKATFQHGEGGPVLTYAVEYDALRGPGGENFHGCQHNMQGPIGIGAAVALKRAMEKHDVPGTIWVIGTPAEEIPPPAKSKMLEAGVFEGTDVLMMYHGSGQTSRLQAGWSGITLDATRYIFTGKSAHASGDPWNGRDALDAARLMFNAVDAYREHILPDARIHGVIPQGGEAPNVIPPLAVADFFYRHPTREYVDKMGERLKNIALGMALATDTQVKIENYGKYYNTLALESLEERAFDYAKELGATQINENKQFGASTDFAELTGYFPSICLSVASKPADAAGHSIEAANASIAPIGHNALVISAKTLALLGLDLLTDPAYLQEVKDEFETYGDPPTLETYIKETRW
ncbi:MAG TPA: M20 family metallopeptidase [Firmicutes bacterium]|nr:M20 family metallopeptidase [Bacillota bacterium]